MTDRPDKSLTELANAHLWLHFNSSRSDIPLEPTVLVSGEGVHVTDSHGRKYIDGISALEAMAVGHGRTELVDAAAAQMQTLAFLDHFRFACEPAIRLASKLADISAPNLTRSFLTPGGAEAIEVAIKMARQYFRIKGQPQRQKVITRQGAFHGCTFGAMGVDGNYWATRNHLYEPTPTFGRIATASNCGECELGSGGRYLACPHKIEDLLLAERPETVAAVVVDPAATAIGVAVPPPQYLADLSEICSAHGVLLVVDEIITGFGRTGRMFDSDYAKIQPDIMTVSKGLTSGYMPLGAAVVSSTVAEAFAHAESLSVFRHGHTYGGHPVACAVALANIEIIQREGLIARSEEMGDYIMTALRKQLKSSPLVHSVRGRGLLVGVEISCDRLVNEEGWEPGEIGTRVRRQCKQNGLITLPLHPGNVLFLAPPLIITENEATELVERFVASVSELEPSLL